MLPRASQPSPPRGCSRALEWHIESNRKYLQAALWVVLLELVVFTVAEGLTWVGLWWVWVLIAVTPAIPYFGLRDLEANRDLWALVYNGMLHSAFHGATVNNTGAGMLRLRPGFEAMRYQERNRGPKIPDRTAWTILLVIVGVFAAIYFLRPDLLGPALAIFAGLVLLLFLVAETAIAITRRRQRRQDAPRD